MLVKITYLEMSANPKRIVLPPGEGLTVVYAKKPTLAYYRFLYNGVGTAWNWPSLNRLSDAALTAIIHDPRVEMHVLLVEGVPAGYVKFDQRVEGEIEIVEFGLMREFIGRGLGKYFLAWTIEKAWSYAPRRVWLHTDTEDHPAALPNYLKAGFAIYKEDVRDWD